MSKSRKSDWTAVFFLFLLVGAMLIGIHTVVCQSAATALERRLPSRFQTRIRHGKTAYWWSAAARWVPSRRIRST
jgi:hypothetical protein